MELKIASNQNKELWDAIVEISPNGTLFHTWKWLNLLEKYSVNNNAGLRSRAKLYHIFIMEKEKPVGIFPLFFFRTHFIKSCYSPPPNIETLYLGPLFPNINSLKQEKRQIFLQESQVLIERFIKKEHKINHIQINTSPGFDDCRPFKWGGYSVEPRYTYQIDLSLGIDQIWKNFNRSLRYYIEKARKEGITIREGTKEDANHIFDMLNERNRVKSPKEFIDEVYEQFSPDHCKVFIAKAGSETLSGIIVIFYKDKVSFWIGSPKCSYNGISPNEFLLWESIRWAAEKGYNSYEIIGADDYSLFPFKRKFNGKIIQYYHVKWFSRSLNVFSSMYKSLIKGSNNMYDL